MSKTMAQKGAKYLSFALAGEEYCISIGNVREIMGIPHITPVPQTPDYVRGVMNLRGNILPVIDLRLKFGLPFLEYGDRTCVVVVELPGSQGTVLTGIVVDTIHEVLSITEQGISRLPYINARIKSEYLQGFSETGNRLHILLDIARALSDSDLESLAGPVTQESKQGAKS